MKHGEYLFKVRSYECGANGEATLPAICNYLQEAASLHAEELGFSKSDFDAAGGNISWVLTRLAVKVVRYPKWEEEVSVETFPRGGRKIVAWRDFIVRDSAGETIALATSEWMVIDLASRKMEAIPARVLGCVDENPESVLGPEPFTPRLKFPGDVESGSERHTFRAQFSHIDLNGHVNNVHYIEWLLEPLAGEGPEEIEVVFRSETLAGDEVGVVAAPGETAAETLLCVSSPDGKVHAVARVRGHRSRL